ncbi:uncharacterized protein CC84DRAFT_1125623 [Paraphaeosphaeria sporulosa]|uniref:Spherulation-specific family 4 n=1 Tax=Paraphaeosphaeria sporulosa TaxID=1460663 RepID=A0A177C8Y2_9PLEO|nr:uncharacterized protein CC84DRAFT_1125623 [Paraphaeosphaeria sporulosa]OAG03299.1 hypothetical protein CC84DRAFT_1125623 [Paraphaeosphaeria sporulosa]
MVAAAAVLLPLYMWPTGPSGESTWQPVLDSAAAYPSLQFTVIVNPNSGPGDWPNPDYAAAIAQLNALSNVQTVGYVDTAQVNQPDGPYTIERIGNDISTYASRSANEPNVALQGVFFDDVSNVYSDSVELLLEEAVNQTKASEGFGNTRTTIINPGTRPNFMTPNVDISLTFESTWEQYRSLDSRAWLAGNPYDRDHTAYVVFGAPPGDVASITTQLRANASYIYVTDTLDDPYKSFGSTWETFIAAMAAE